MAQHIFGVVVVILLAIPCLLMLVFGVLAFFESFDNEEAIAKGFIRENEDPESYSGTDLHVGYTP